MDNKISNEKIDKYIDLTSRALAQASNAIIKDKEKQAEEIISMVSNYLSDAKHFYQKGKWVDCFAALNYAHGWLDAGVRLDVFDVDDDSLFTVR
ncbi:MAG: DUF357 domain-containing protein [Candidatus Nanoarchaeia archaeon]